MARIGYARTGPVGQRLGVQLEKHRPCKATYQEKKSGSAGTCASIGAFLEYVRGGDTLVVMPLDRIAPSTLRLVPDPRGIATPRCGGAGTGSADRHLHRR